MFGGPRDLPASPPATRAQPPHCGQSQNWPVMCPTLTPVPSAAESLTTNLPTPLLSCPHNLPLLGPTPPSALSLSAMPIPAPPSFPPAPQMQSLSLLWPLTALYYIIHITVCHIALDGYLEYITVSILFIPVSLVPGKGHSK